MTLLTLILLSTHAFAMPCDTAYMCTSQSGKYKIEIGHCRYGNSLGGIPTFQIAGKDVTGTLGAAFDGADFGGFEIAMPSQGDHQRILSIEWTKKTSKGTIRDESRDYDPAGYKIDFSEPITCIDED